MFKTLGTTVEFPELETVELDGKRHYITPSGNYYPSITTVLSLQSKAGIDRWKKRIGEKEAEKQSYQASVRGTYMHYIIEDYLKNDYNPLKYSEHPLSQFLFGICKQDINRINNIHAQEIPLYSDKLKIAGRCDCIAEFDGILSIIDFKTSKKEKEEKYILNYFVQESAYAAMYYELTGIPIKQIVTIISTECGSSQVFVKNDIMYYMKFLIKYIDQYKKANG